MVWTHAWILRVYDFLYFLLHQVLLKRLLLTKDCIKCPEFKDGEKIKTTTSFGESGFHLISTDVNIKLRWDEGSQGTQVIHSDDSHWACSPGTELGAGEHLCVGAHTRMCPCRNVCVRVYVTRACALSSEILTALAGLGEGRSLSRTWTGPHGL